ncbi:trypsin alpha-3-like [Anastrepha obliqua]|uniref:trypsin alpha-3-like n=1 Tax=Anastrepha obliqua TaxID=95512 RepID=UPI00240A0C75|nr:trypsin alpha-3-like [Anastrepha obliqua]
MFTQHGRSLFFLLLGLCASIVPSVAAPEGRIVGGTTVDIFDAPHLVSLRYKHNSSTPFIHRCSGTIYSQDVVLTTARCVIGLTRQQLQIVAGTSYRSQTDGSVYLVNTTVIHPDFNIWFIDNDLALLHLEFPLATNNSKVIKPIDLAAAVPAAGSAATVAGWGATAEQAALAEQLQQADVRLINDTQCKATYGTGRISAAMLCAGGVSSSGSVIDACQGDAGSALVANGNAVGLVSWGSGCGREGYPGVYTNLVHFKEWIESEANKKI